MKPTILLAVLASMLLLTGIACGGTTQETDTETDAGAMSGETTTTDSASEQATTAPDSGSSAGSGQASQPGATSIVATATPSATNTPSAAQQTEFVGGRLSMAVTPPVQEVVRSWLGTTTSANSQVRMFADPLVHTDRFDGSLQPGLATDWEITKADGTQWVFRLREDIPFHGDWGEFTAHDLPHSAALLGIL